jgi:homocysteine S-methyltransferase
MTYAFLPKLDQQPLLCDGAMGTMIYTKGIHHEACFDELNLSQPALIAEIHRAYIDAGSQVIETNTFEANRLKLAKHGLADKLAEINQAGVKLARRVAEASYKEIFVAGSVGPLGKNLAPLGRLTAHEAREIFREQLAALLAVGIDLLMFETFADPLELKEAVLAARELDAAVPIVAQMTFMDNGRTPLGYAPKKVAALLADLPIDVMGVNCSAGPAVVLRNLQLLASALPAGTRLSAQPNAGWPEHIGERTMYPASPDYFGEFTVSFIEAGARLIGGCCGTTPQHIAQMRTALDTPSRYTPRLYQLPHEETIAPEPLTEVEPTPLARQLAQGNFVVTVEMSPPKGFSVEKMLAGAMTLQAVGATAINVADSPRSMMRMSPWAACHLIQSKLGLETVLHFPTRGRNILRVQGDLLAAHALNIRNIFVVMGDPPAIGEYPEASDSQDVVPSGLIKLLKQGFNQGIDHSGEPIVQPTNFLVACALNLTPADPAREISVLRRKIESGADFALTQPIYEVAVAQAFVKQYEDSYGPLTLPILGGVLPLYSTRHAEFLHNEVPGITIPDDIRHRMKAAGDKGSQVGIELAHELILQLRPLVQGIYLMPAFSRYDLAAEVIEVLQDRK